MMHVAVLHTLNRELRVGQGCHTRVMALIGATNPAQYAMEMKKLEALNSSPSRPDVVSDLSLALATPPLWKRIIFETDFIAATLPVYHARPREGIIDHVELLDHAVEQMEAGVGLLTIHPTPTREIIGLAEKRMVPCTSRGGGMVIRDLISRPDAVDNVYLKILPELIQAARKNKTVLSLGASFRSANIFDSNDLAQQAELAAQKDLADAIKSQGVDVIIESPGHASPKDIAAIGASLKSFGYPVMPLGPMPTDAAVGQDHIAASIGAVLLGVHGAAHILAAVTREEHTGGIPALESVVEAVAAACVAAHIIDIACLNDAARDLELARFRQHHRTCVVGKISRGCSRCGSVCPL